ncbi:hypothetical protein ACERNI_07105 [Camelimonas sp. ID_303_24]
MAGICFPAFPAGAPVAGNAANHNRRRQDSRVPARAQMAISRQLRHAPVARPDPAASRRCVSAMRTANLTGDQLSSTGQAIGDKNFFMLFQGLSAKNDQKPSGAKNNMLRRSKRDRMNQVRRSIRTERLFQMTGLTIRPAYRPKKRPRQRRGHEV